jgi:hypothetical protein
MGVDAGIAGLIGMAQQCSPATALLSFADFQHGPVPDDIEIFALAIRGFFENGGTACHVTRIAPADTLSLLVLALYRIPGSAFASFAALKNTTSRMRRNSWRHTVKL